MLYTRRKIGMEGGRIKNEKKRDRSRETDKYRKGKGGIRGGGKGKKYLIMERDEMEIKKGKKLNERRKKTSGKTEQKKKKNK